MSKQKSVPDSIDRFSRRTFLGASAVVGGSATAIAAGLLPLRLPKAEDFFDSDLTGLQTTDDTPLGFCPIGAVYWVYADSEPPEEGTKAAPFRTIQAAVDRMEEELVDGVGATIVVQEGREPYHEVVTLKKSGTELAPIVLAAFPGETPVIDGGANPPPCYYDEGGLQVCWSELPEVADFDPVKFEGLDDTYKKLVEERNQGLPSLNKLQLNSLYKTKMIEEEVEGEIVKSKYIIGFQKGNKYWTGFFYKGLININASNVVLEGLKVTRSMGAGVQVKKDKGETPWNVTIRGCEFSDCRGKGISLEDECANVTIDACEVHGNGNFAPYHRPGGTVVWPGMLHLVSCSHVTIRRTKVYNNWGEGILLDCPQNAGSRIRTNNVTITECTCYDNYATSIYVHGVHDVRLKRNLIYRSKAGGGQPADVPPEDASTGITVAGSETVRIPSNVENIDILNNIVVGFGTNMRFTKRAEEKVVGEEKVPIDKRYVKKVNVLSNTFVNGAMTNLNMVSENNEECEFKSNLSFQSSPPKNPPYPDPKPDPKPDPENQVIMGNEKSKKGWTFSNNAWSYDPPFGKSDSDFTGDPLMVNPGITLEHGEANAADYQIKPDSPLVAPPDNPVALPSSLVSEDYFANWRKSKPNMGAHEYREELKSWSEWAPFHSPSQSFRYLTSAINRDGRLELFGLAKNSSPWHTTQQTNGWNEWTRFHDPQQRFKKMIAGRRNDGLVEVFAIHSNNSVLHTVQDNSSYGWSKWKRFYQPTDKFLELYLGVNEDGRLEIFGLGEDHTVWHNWQHSKGEWQEEWLRESLTDKFVHLAISTSRDEGLAVFGLTESGNLRYNRQQRPNQPPWCGWEQIYYGDAMRFKDVSAAKGQDGHLELFALDSAGSPWHTTQSLSGGWNKWTVFHSYWPRLKEINAATGPDGRIHVVGRANNNILLHSAQTAPNNGWSEWEQLHSATDRFFTLALGMNQDAGLEVFAVKRDYTPWHTWQRP